MTFWKKRSFWWFNHWFKTFDLPLGIYWSYGYHNFICLIINLFNNKISPTTTDNLTFLLWSFEDGHRPILPLWSILNVREFSKTVENGRKLSKTVQKIWMKFCKFSQNDFISKVMLFKQPKKSKNWPLSTFVVRSRPFSTFFECSRLIFDRSKSMNVRWRSESIFKWSQKKCVFVQSSMFFYYNYNKKTFIVLH